MGWFGKTGRGRNRGKRRSATRFADNLLVPAIVKQRKHLAVAALIIATLVGWRYAKSYLVDNAAAATTAPTSQQVRLADAPPWLNKLVRQHLRQQVSACLQHDPWGRASLGRSVAALEQNPWVRKVRRLRRQRNGTVTVSADYRRPVAVVGSQHGYHRVDVHGVQLPGLFVHSKLESLGMPLIMGVGAPPPGEGLHWPGDDLFAALALVRFLEDQPYRKQIKYIDASSRDHRGRVRLALVTQNGCVRWGLAPGIGDPIEPDTSIKLRRLATVYRRWRAIDAGGKTVDIYGPAIFIRSVAHHDRQIQAGYTISQQ